MTAGQDAYFDMVRELPPELLDEQEFRKMQAQGEADDEWDRKQEQ